MKKTGMFCFFLFVLARGFGAGLRPLESRPAALITLSVANLRKEPDHRSELVTQAVMGTPVAILREKNGWLYIQTPDRYTGWTEASSLKRYDVAAMEAWKTAGRVIYTAPTGWITGNDGKAVVSDITGGAIVVKTGQEGGLASVLLPDGRKGYVEASLLAGFDDFRKQGPPAADALIRTALEYMGIPYLWGGSSPKAADCSGFMQSVFFRNGMLLLRDASQQATLGTRVETRNGLNLLQPGDLLFFGNPATQHVTHVALYLGNLDYIHASGCVHIASLDPANENYNEDRRNALLFAGRLTDSGAMVPLALSQHPWY